MSPSSELQKWHILTFIPDAPGAAADKIIARFNHSLSDGEETIQLFAPKYSVPTLRAGKIQFKAVPLTFFYVFVRGLQQQIKRLCALRRGFAFLLDRAGVARYATISDSRMQQFMTIARAYSNTLPFFSPADIDLAAGDLVEVIDGDFPGLRGHYLPTPRSKSGTIILQVDQGLATAAFNIRADQIRILEFAPGSGREYDQIDHFIPRLLQALRINRQGEPLPRPLAASVSVFASRMEAVNLQNRKLRHKLDALLLGAMYLLGRPDQAASHLKKLRRGLTDDVTNPWTRSLIYLIMALTHIDADAFTLGRQEISTLTPLSKLQQLIAQEYELNRPHFNA